MTRAVKADELGDVLEVLSEDKLVAFGNDRHITHAEREQPLASAAVIQHVDHDEIDAFFRKKLFRSEAAASPRLGEQYEFVSDGTHWRVIGVGCHGAYYRLHRRVKHLRLAVSPPRRMGTSARMI
jgi:hypothetical protein